MLPPSRLRLGIPGRELSVSCGRISGPARNAEAKIEERNSSYFAYIGIRYKGVFLIYFFFFYFQRSTFSLSLEYFLPPRAA